MPRLRVMLGAMPRILRQILKDLVERQPDMEVVGEVGTLAGLPKAIESCRAQAVILTLPLPDDADTLCTLRQGHPGITLLTIARHHDRAAIWPIGEDPRPVDVSASGILAALRQPRRGPPPDRGTGTAPRPYSVPAFVGAAPGRWYA